jgi:hypothetical protein
MEFTYRPEILAQLLEHGVRPAPRTRPAIVAEYLNDLYRYELRRLKARLIGGAIPKDSYSDRVVALRRQYPLVSLPVRLWTVPGTPPDPEDVPLC